ncbi:MAG: TIGR00730 family Rossman fold protein [Thiohalorhabdus sp.]|uniref:LOG family protein n=1 Tax=Thiohalorhabdus sp. TaxID=3094134 RepID=UPI003980FBE0
MERICVFAGSGSGNRPAYAEAAAALGARLAEGGIGVVYGGGHTGLMGVLADAALAAGGEVVGVIPEALCTRELAHHQLSELEVVSSMHARKARMAELADAFIALPGGIGTLEELFEVFTWAQLGLHAKPCGLLNAAGFYDPLVRFLDETVAEGFLRPDQRALLEVDSEPADLLTALAACHPVPAGGTWIGPDQT